MRRAPLRVVLLSLGVLFGFGSAIAHAVHSHHSYGHWHGHCHQHDDRACERDCR
jgi:hypothetical protein